MGDLARDGGGPGCADPLVEGERTDAACSPHGNVAGGTGSASRLRATSAAHDAVRRLTRTRGAVTFVQSGRRGRRGLPVCVPSGAFFIEESDRKVGEVDGARFYVDADLDDAAGHPVYRLDVADGEADELTLGVDPTHHFVATW